MIDFLVASPCYAAAELIDDHVATLARWWCQIVFHSIISGLEPM